MKLCFNMLRFAARLAPHYPNVMFDLRKIMAF